MVKSICVRFNLDNEADRKAWQKIHNDSKSANRAIIDAINNIENDSVAETIRTVLKEFFSSGQPIAIQTQQETDLQDVDFDFLGG